MGVTDSVPVYIRYRKVSGDSLRKERSREEEKLIRHML